jgi:hypothetical protein
MLYFINFYQKLIKLTTTVPKGLKGILSYLSIMEETNKVCNKCKKGLPLELFGASVQGHLFKQCDRCRLRGRAENARSRLRRKSMIQTQDDPSIIILVPDLENPNLLGRIWEYIKAKA